MKKIIFLVFGALLTFFIIFFGISTYQYYQALHIDDPIDPYILVESGSATVVRDTTSIDIPAEEQFSLQERDTIITYANSASTIFWPDRSLTRLGENTQFVIHKMQVSDDYWKIELEASILQGKIYSNMVRTLYPGSHMTIKMPNQWIVAGVRGTVFSINLDNNYIHSIDHMVSLQDKDFSFFTQNFSLLLPGEIVSTKNIFEKLASDVLDTAWENVSALKNSEYLSQHAKNVEAAFNTLLQKVSSQNYFDILVQKILSYFDAFADLEFVKYVDSYTKNISLPSLSSEVLEKWYQKLKISDFAQERDIIRGAIYNLSNLDTKAKQILETLTTESLWDKMQFPELDLKNSEKILSDFAQKINTTSDDLLYNLTTKNYSEEILNELKNIFSSY